MVHGNGADMSCRDEHMWCMATGPSFQAMRCPQGQGAVLWQDLNQLTASLDLNNDGMINYGEFVQAHHGCTCTMAAHAPWLHMLRA